MDPAARYLSHCAAIFQVIGHQYFSVKSLKPENRESKPLFGYAIYFIILLFAITGQMVYLLTLASPENFKEQLSAKNVIDYIVQQSIFFGSILVISIGIIQSFMTTQLTKKFYWNCFKISKLCLDDFQNIVDYRKIRACTFKYLIFLVLYIIAAEAVYFCNLFFLNDPSLMLGIFISSVPMIFLHTNVLKFIFLLKLVNFHLETIFELFTELLDPPLTIVENLIYVKPWNMNKLQGLKHKILNINRIYNVIYENAQIINRSMGVSILLITAINVVKILSSGYRIFLAFVGSFEVQKCTGNSLILCLLLQVQIEVQHS